MGFLRYGVFTVNVMVFLCMVGGEPLVPAFCIMGDSVVDVGNNNNLITLVKANFPPYGRDFSTHRPTGRFCNGKLATDFTAEVLGFDTYPLPYLSRDARGRNLLIGANFASAASGYYDPTSQLYGVISLTQQVAHYREWQNKVVGLVGRQNATDIFSRGIHLLSAGSSDFVQNYYINPVLNLAYSPNQFSDILLNSYSNFVQNMYALGVRKIGVTSLPPTGCLPAVITLFGRGRNECVARLNKDAVLFNDKLNATSQDLLLRFRGLKLVVFDIYQPLLDLIKKPTDNGFCESRRACCGTGTIETSLLCNSRSIGTCSNATQYVFWDGFHPSEAANLILAQNLFEQGISLIS